MNFRPTRTCSRLSRRKYLQKMSGGNILADTTVRAAATQDLRFSEQDPFMSGITEDVPGDVQSPRQRRRLPSKNELRQISSDVFLMRVDHEGPRSRIGAPRHVLFDAQYKGDIMKAYWYINHELDMNLIATPLWGVKMQKNKKNKVI